MPEQENETHDTTRIAAGSSATVEDKRAARAVARGDQRVIGCGERSTEETQPETEIGCGKRAALKREQVDVTTLDDLERDPPEGKVREITDEARRERPEELPPCVPVAAATARALKQAADDLCATFQLAPPAEEGTVLALREAFERFNGAALTRNTFTADDRAQLDAIDALLATYREESRVAWNADPFVERGNGDDAVGRIKIAVSNYRAFHAREMRTPFADGGHVDTPAIESPTVRGEIANRGADILAKIDAEIAAIHKRQVAAVDLRVQLVRVVEFWLSIDPMRSFLRFLVNAWGIRVGPLSMLSLSQDGLRALQNPVDAFEESAGRPRPTHLFIRRERQWLPFVAALLEASETITPVVAAPKAKKAVRQ